MEKHLKKALLFVVLSITISTMYFSRSLLLKPFISHHNISIESEINSMIANASVPFIKNEGQADKEVSFYASTLCSTAFVTRKSEIVYSLGEIKENETNEYKTIALKETLVNVNAPFVHGEDLSETKVNIFLGDDSSQWKKNIPTYNTVSLGELYEGIEVKLKAYNNNIEKLFYISSKGNVKDIKIKISGADTLTLGRGGELLANTSLGTIAFTKPIAYQEINGKRTYVEVKYTMNKDIYAFDVGNYDKTVPLVIDPLLASTFVGGSDSDYGYDVVLDASNNVYIAGYTNSFSYPTTTGVYQTAKSGGYDVFVSKFNSDLSVLSASTFIGGSSTDRAYAIALDSSCNVYIAGYTNSTNYPINNAYQAANNGNYDVFISKLSNNLSTLLSSTYVGSSSYDYAYGIALDSLDNVYITGYTNSINYPTTVDVYQTVNNGGYDAFVSKFNNDLSVLSASTFIGGSGSDNALKIALNSSGNLYITGYTDSSDYPVTANAYQSERKGLTDVFVSKLTNDLKVLSSSTYVGGSNYDRAYAFTFDSSNNVYITGETYSSDYPTTIGVYQPGNNGGYDAFVSKISDDLSTLLASTFAGGSSHDYAYGIALNSENNVYITGKTLSADYPTTDMAYETEFNGSSDVFVSKFNGDLSTLSASTFIGGTSDEEAHGIAIDSSDTIYAIGFTNSSDYPITNRAYQINNSGTCDTFVCKFNSDLAADTYTINATADSNGLISPSGNIIVNYGSNQTFTITPDTGYHIKDVLVDNVSIDSVSTYTFESVKANHTISATFEIDTHALNVTVSGNANVTKNPDQINYDYGAVVTLTATPDTGWHFVGWSGDATGSDNPLIVTMDSNKNITALFEINTYTINATAVDHGTISPSGDIVINYGDNQTFIITGDAGYVINQIIVDGSSIKPISKTYTFTNITSNHAISATFAKIPDTTPPTLTLSGVDLNVSTITSSSFFSFDFIAADNSGNIARTVIKNNGITIKDIMGLPIGNDPTITLFEGINDIEVTVYDASGNFATKSFRVISDTKPPIVKLNNIPESVSSNELDITGTVFDTDTGVKEIKINGKTVALSLSGKINITCTLTPGRNIITVQSTDKAGNTMTETYTVNYIVPTPATIITLQINNPEVTINGISKTIDAQNSKPIIENDRTLLPIRILIESLGGTVSWNGETREVTINLTYHTIILTIDNNTAIVDGIKMQIDPNNKVTPIIINGRTYLPLRFIAEHLNANVNWDNETRTVTMYYWP